MIPPKMIHLFASFSVIGFRRIFWITNRIVIPKRNRRREVMNGENALPEYLMVMPPKLNSSVCKIR